MPKSSRISAVEEVISMQLLWKSKKFIHHPVSLHQALPRSSQCQLLPYGYCYQNLAVIGKYSKCSAAISRHVLWWRISDGKHKCPVWVLYVSRWFLQVQGRSLKTMIENSPFFNNWVSGWLSFCQELPEEWCCLQRTGISWKKFVLIATSSPLGQNGSLSIFPLLAKDLWKWELN